MHTSNIPIINLGRNQKKNEKDGIFLSNMLGIPSKNTENILENQSLKSAQSMQNIQGIQGIQNFQPFQGIQGIQGIESSTYSQTLSQTLQHNYELDVQNNTQKSKLRNNPEYAIKYKENNLNLNKNNFEPKQQIPLHSENRLQIPNIYQEINYQQINQQISDKNNDPNSINLENKFIRVQKSPAKLN